MNQKNNMPKRTFIPQPIGKTIDKIKKKFPSKLGKVEFIIHSKWKEITGSYFAEFSEPSNISKLQDYENEFGEVIYKNYLNVSVAPGAALEFQHFKDKILEKINSYFGYKAIIDLRIQQNYIPKHNTFKDLDMNNKKLTNTDNKTISDEVKDLDNKNLKESLINLGRNISKEGN